MDNSKTTESETQNECEYSSAFNKLTGTSDNNICTQDDVKIKVEIELKEAENDLVYQPDFYGHLRLVNLNQIASDTSSDVKNNSTGNMYSNTLIIFQIISVYLSMISK